MLLLSAGDASLLYDNIHSDVFSLPDETLCKMFQPTNKLVIVWYCYLQGMLHCFTTTSTARSSPCQMRLVTENISIYNRTCCCLVLLPAGDAALLYDNIHSKIFSLPDYTLIYPGHDYKGRTVSSVAEEKALNPRLTKPKEQFVQLMADLNLPLPKQIQRSLPANLRDGVDFPYA